MAQEALRTQSKGTMDGGAQSGALQNNLEQTVKAEGALAQSGATQAVKDKNTFDEALRDTKQDEDDATSQPAKTDAANAEIHLLFAGDVYLSDHVLGAYERAGGIDGVLDGGYREAIKAADRFIVNEEFPFSTRGTPAPDKQFTFRLPPERVKLLQEMDIDLVTLANNHALDFGTDALLDTIDTLDAAGIAHVGAGRNISEAEAEVIQTIQGKRIAFIGASRVAPVASWAAGEDSPGMLLAYDATRLVQKIQSVRAQADYVVVLLHWGIERAEYPNEAQERLGAACIDAGADLIVGAHPHVLQGVRYYKDKPIVYSLGNFVFGSSIPKTALLEVTLAGDETLAASLRLLPGTSSAGYTRMLSDAAEKQAFYDYMEGISEGINISEDGSIVRGE